jgi:hypothetical protein
VTVGSLCRRSMRATELQALRSASTKDGKSHTSTTAESVSQAGWWVSHRLPRTQNHAGCPTSRVLAP